MQNGCRCQVPSGILYLDDCRRHETRVGSGAICSPKAAPRQRPEDHYRLPKHGMAAPEYGRDRTSPSARDFGNRQLRRRRTAPDRADRAAERDVGGVAASGDREGYAMKPKPLAPVPRHVMEPLESRRFLSAGSHLVLSDPSPAPHSTRRVAAAGAASGPAIADTDFLTLQDLRTIPA